MSLLDKIMFGTGAAILLFIAIFIMWLLIANAHLRAKLAEANANGTACHLVNDEFRQKLEQQNQAVLALRNESAARAKKALEAEQKALGTATQLQKHAAHLAQQKSSGDDCKEAAKLLDGYIAEGK